MLRCTVAETSADVVAADDQILTVVGATADHDMDMRVVGVPMVDRDHGEPTEGQGDAPGLEAMPSSS
jgi:hypothetical protein